MSTVCTRSSLIENEDMPSSYLAPAIPGMIPENALFWNSAVSPSFCATAVPSSTSQPMMVLPSVSVNSFGGYDASVPKTILPSAETAAGTIAASASSLVTVGAADAGASDGAPAGAEAGAPPPPSPPEPQLARVNASAVTASARDRGRVRLMDGLRGVRDEQYAGMLPLSCREDTLLAVTIA
jgi:hypothetical protein